MLSDSITEKQFIILCKIKTRDDRISQAMDNLTGEPTMANLIKAVKLCDKHTSEYMTEYRNLVKSPLESYQAFAQRLRSTYCKGVGSNASTLTACEQKLLVETFLNSLEPSSANIIRIVADESELSNLSKIAERASRMPKSKSVNTLIDNIQAESQNESDDSKFCVQEDDALLSIIGLKVDN